VTENQQPSSYDLEQHAATLDDLARVLDLDSGWRDISALEQASGETLTELEQVLDLDAGLAAIRPPRVIPTPMLSSNAPYEDEADIFTFIDQSHRALSRLKIPSLRPHGFVSGDIRRCLGRASVYLRALDAGLRYRTIGKDLADIYASGAERAVDQVIYIAEVSTQGRDELGDATEFIAAARHILEGLHQIVVIVPRLFDEADAQVESLH
jgi:hypothetical protein